MEDPKSKKGGRDKAGAGGPQGIGVPAKGDSSASNVPLGPDDGATISDAPITPPKPATRVVHPDLTISDEPSITPAKPGTRIGGPDLTISDEVPGSRVASRAVSGMYIRETSLEPGDIIGGRYEILQLLGEGGMGAVYKALDREVERTVALKLIRPELAANPQILARFKQELLTAHQVTHKNVIRIYDIAEADGVKFITMEYVEGF
ncbi:MAG: protein kinase, partial [Acidobacteriota bacterium]|nr:protein kinase [Acidobacteriota bacterium]